MFESFPVIRDDEGTDLDVEALRAQAVNVIFEKKASELRQAYGADIDVNMYIDRNAILADVMKTHDQLLLTVIRQFNGPGFVW